MNGAQGVKMIAEVIDILEVGEKTGFVTADDDSRKKGEEHKMEPIKENQQRQGNLQKRGKLKFVEEAETEKKNPMIAV